MRPYSISLNIKLIEEKQF